MRSPCTDRTLAQCVCTTAACSLQHWKTLLAHARDAPVSPWAPRQHRLAHRRRRWAVWEGGLGAWCCVCFGDRQVPVYLGVMLCRANSGRRGVGGGSLQLSLPRWDGARCERVGNVGNCRRLSLVGRVGDSGSGTGFADGRRVGEMEIAASPDPDVQGQHPGLIAKRIC